VIRIIGSTAHAARKQREKERGKLKCLAFSHKRKDEEGGHGEAYQLRGLRVRDRQGSRNGFPDHLQHAHLPRSFSPHTIRVSFQSVSLL
jgi:hypothetical protein